MRVKSVWADRIIGSGEKSPREFLSNPANFRVHPRAQEGALEDVLDRVGWVRRILVNRTTGNVVDGHLRLALALRRGEASIPYDEVELSEAEERLVLAALDPIGAMAETDFEKLRDLLDGVDLSVDQPLEALLASLVAPTAGQQEGQRAFRMTTLGLDELRVHVRNYREHPQDQIEHLARSIQTYGLYRNIVVANEGTILAGHGVVQALRTLGVSRVPVVELPFGPEDPRAIRLLIGDNEIGKLGMADDRALTQLLKEILDADVEGLMGTGYSPEQLAALVMTTRPKAEVQSIDAAAEWVGMPEYENVAEPIKLVVSFRNKADRAAFLRKNDLVIMKKLEHTWSTWWPTKEQDDHTAVIVEG